MKIYHVSHPQNLISIKKDKIIYARPTFYISYDDYGEKVDLVEDRAYFCLTQEEAELIKMVFERYYGEDFDGGWEIGEFEVKGDLDYVPDGKSWGYFSRQDIRIK